MSLFWLSRAEVRELDKRASEEYGVPGIVLMENAGRGCAELLMRLNTDRKPVVILCGPGNNGGDGFVIARHLDNHGWPVKIVRPPGTTELKGDASTNRRIVEQSKVPMLASLPETLDAPVWFVDALFGTGLSRPLAAPFDEIVSRVSASRYPILAVDIPSGLDCDSGEPLGPTIRATHTATFVGHKKGFLNPASRAWTGEVHVIDIGAPRPLIDEYRRRDQSSR